MTTIAELTFIPLNTPNSREKVSDILEFIAQQDLEVDIHPLSTTVRGTTDNVFSAIREIYDMMTMEGEHFRFHIQLLSPHDA